MILAVVIDNSLTEYESDKEYVEYLRDLQAVSTLFQFYLNPSSISCSVDMANPSRELDTECHVL